MENTVQVSADILVNSLIAIISIILILFPVLRVKFAGLKTELKSTIIIGIIVVEELIVYVLGSTGSVIFLNLNGGVISWTPFPWLYLVMLFWEMIAVSQGAYKLGSAFEPKDVTEAKALRE